MTGTQLVVSAVGLVALGHTLVDYLRQVVNLRTTAAKQHFVAQTIAFAAFVGLVLIASQAKDSFGAVPIMGDQPLSQMDVWSQVLIGLSLGGGGGLVTKLLQARDQTQSAAQPPFVGAPPIPEP